ncbi:ClbS/DfsB family four-helix bundle protein [Rossellomorea marisflavi]|uniref:ClbS/DfsB family four-helix bundle protein n=1 Tax=Rossellomorea marisflavi TaxID=189381 RepID=UPI0013194CE6|nr:ClbS/DfsB family four-helix bundle protein [Rossellomorea marisflavi]QHA38239.1 ClbS/DfsB family four-helix bundle protein [Rossellomorea marisflavi]
MTDAEGKERLILKSEEAFQTLMNLITSIPPRKRKESIITDERDKNFRDVLMHLYEWHSMLERWYREGMDGDEPSMPAPGYQWRDIGALNQKIWDDYQEVPLNKAIKKVTKSHTRVMDLINRHSTEEIMTKKYVKWTKTSHLYSYFAANTYKHYEWALRKCAEIKGGLMSDTMR